MSTTAATRTYTSPEVVTLLGVSYRQLHHWVTRGWIPGLAGIENGGYGSGRGHGWQWTSEQVVAAWAIRDHLNQARALMEDPTSCQRRLCTHPGGGAQ